MKIKLDKVINRDFNFKTLNQKNNKSGPFRESKPRQKVRLSDFEEELELHNERSEKNNS